MKDRTSNKNNNKYHDYGGRGITVCEGWADSYVAFRNWSLLHGYDNKAKRGKCTIDRIDNNGNYCPENCRWVSQVVQCNNSRANRIIKHNGIELSVAQWARKLGISPQVIYSRIHIGWSETRAIMEPFHKRVDHNAIKNY
jgi:predicted oxidoreductase